MAQNIYDQPDFFSGYSRLGRQLHGLAGAAEWPAVKALLPDLTGKRIVDLGCGFGWFARFAREHGAAYVLGVDLSEKMIARAKADTSDPHIEYRIADLEELDLAEASFDFAYSSLAFHYVEDFQRLAQKIYCALRPGASFIFTIEHPIFMAPTQPGWSTDAQGRKTWPIDRYSVEGPRVTDWLAKGVVKQHRMIGTTLNTLIGSGFVLRHIEEWAPTPGQVEATPDLADERERPMLLIVAAQR